MEPLSYLEVLIVSKLIVGEHPTLATLRTQLKHCRAKKREFSGVGFFTELLVPKEYPSATLSRSRIQIGDVIADMKNVENGVGFLLSIEDGRLSMLEGYTFDEPWPKEMGILSLNYTSTPRVLTELE
jgi:hypothetical protein